MFFQVEILNHISPPFHSVFTDAHKGYAGLAEQEFVHTEPSAT